VARAPLDAEEQIKADSINILVEAKLTDLKNTITVRETQGLAAGIATMQQGRGVGLMQSLRARITDLQQSVAGDIEAGDNDIARTSNQLTFIQIAGALSV
jgi:CHASE3 domain sensor protein